MKFFGHLDLNQNQLQRAIFELVEEFPVSPKVGQLCFKGEDLFCCVALEGTPVWFRVTGGIRAVVHNFTNSLVVNAAHEYGKDLVVQVYDSNNRILIPDYIDTNLENMVQVSFSQPQSGKVVILSSGANRVEQSMQQANADLQAELDATQLGAGLESNGSLAPFTASNFIVGAVSLRQAVVALDGQLNTVSTSKLNVSDVINNLTSTDTNKALSANQGKVLDDKIASIVPGENVRILSVTDLKTDGEEFGTGFYEKIFGIYDIVQLNPNVNGSVWASFSINPTWALASNVVFDLYYALGSTDNSKSVLVETRVWVGNIGGTPALASPTHSGQTTITSSATNTLKITKVTLNGHIPASGFNYDSTIGLCVRRLGANAGDNYTGNFNVLKLVVRQN